MGLQRYIPSASKLGDRPAGREVKAEAGARPVAWMQPVDSGRRAVAVDAPRQHRSRGRGPGGGGAIRWRAQRRGLAELEEAQLRFPLGRFETISVFAVFYFYIFYFRFLQKYIFVFEIYRNIPRPPHCRAAGTWSPCCEATGVFLQKFSRRICAEAPGGLEAAGQSHEAVCIHLFNIG